MVEEVAPWLPGSQKIPKGATAIATDHAASVAADDSGTDSGTDARFFFVDANMGRAKEVADTFPQAKVLGWDPSGGESTKEVIKIYRKVHIATDSCQESAAMWTLRRACP